MARLTVLLPVYRPKENLLERAVASTVQNLIPDAEILIIVDGDPAAIPLVEKICTNDKRIRYHALPANGGVAKALNAGLAHSDSEFVARMDADDVTMPGRFARQKKRLVERGLDMVFGPSVNLSRFGRPTVPMRQQALLPHSLLIGNPCIHSSMFARRDSVGSDPYRALAAEDYDLWMRLCLLGMKLEISPGWPVVGRHLLNSSLSHNDAWQSRLVAELDAYATTWTMLAESIGVKCDKETALLLARVAVSGPTVDSLSRLGIEASHRFPEHQALNRLRERALEAEASKLEFRLFSARLRRFRSHL